MKSLNTDMESESFKKIITTHEKTSYIGEDAIMVTQERGIEHPSTYVELFKDYIVYGIDPDTFEATTPIWSQLQDKTIPICSKEEYKKNGIEKETRTQYTIRTKIDGYMQKMMDRIPKRNYDLIDRELAGIHLGFKPSKKKKNENLVILGLDITQHHAVLLVHNAIAIDILELRVTWLYGRVSLCRKTCNILISLDNTLELVAKEGAKGFAYFHDQRIQIRHSRTAEVGDKRF